MISRTYSQFEERKRWPTLFDFSLRNSWKILGIWVAQTAQAEHHNAYKLLLFWSTLLVIPSGADQGFLSRSVTFWGNSIGALCYKLVCLNTQTTLPFGCLLLQTSLVMYIKRMTYTVAFRGNAVTMTTAEGGFVCKGVSIRRRGTVFGLLVCNMYRYSTLIQYTDTRRSCNDLRKDPLFGGGAHQAKIM